MIANYHVLFVHFPAALLPLYAISELVRFRFVLDKPYWFYVKATFAIMGMVSAHVASLFGESIEDSILTKHPDWKILIETHSGMATITTLIFTILGLAYLISWMERERPTLFVRIGMFGKLMRWGLVYMRLVLKSSVSFILAFLGLASIIITGALGGAIVHGPEVDPMVTLIYHLFVRS